MTWLFAFLLATLGLSLWLGYQAQDAARSHREVAESTVRDYARIAAWQYARVASEELDGFLRQLFDDVPHRARRRPPAATAVWWELDDALAHAGCTCAALRNPPLVFRLDLRSDEWSVMPDTFDSHRLRGLAAALRSAAARPDAREHDVLLVPAGHALSEPAAVPHAFTSDSLGPALVYGVVFDAAAFGELFGAWYQRGRLLPPAITGDAPNDSVLHVAVRGPGSVLLYGSPIANANQPVASDTLRHTSVPLTVEAAIRPDAVSRLIIGGLPTSRLPLILGLLMLTLGVGLAALFQVRRERQLARLRDDFVSGVSHELRTPLAQIRMFAELQDAGKLRTSEERERAISVINREAQRLTNLVENILRFSRLRHAPERRSVRESIDVACAVSEVLEAFRPLAAGRRMSVRAEIEPAIHVLANRDVLNQVLLNLLDNAVKYGPVGQTITVAAGIPDVERQVARITVRDEGPGIPLEDRARVWQPYLRLSRHLEASLPGTGLGLAVVAQLLEANGGRAFIDDAPGRGACFVVELPASAVPTPAVSHEVCT